jgi:hypothetical protein
MSKKYVAGLVIFSFMLIFYMLFYFMFIGASGHRYEFTIKDFLLPIYFVITIATLIAFPNINNDLTTLKFILRFLSIGLLGISLFLSYKLLHMFYSGDLVISFLIFATVAVVVFCAVVLILIIEVFKTDRIES